MPLWTITYDNGSGPVEKSAADWGLNAQPVIKTRDRSETVFSFRMAGADPAVAIPFPFRSQVTIRQNRTFANGGWTGGGFVFVGYQTTERGRVDGKGQGVMVDFADAIWLMKSTTFQQLWTQNISDGHGGINTVPIPVSRCILFMDINSYIATPWTLKSVQWQVNEIITYAASCGIAVKAGTIDYSGYFINYTHVRAISCWDALLKCLEILPDAKIWIDASTTPPSLHVRTRANIAAMATPSTTAPGPITLPWRATDALGRKHFASEFTPRHDLVPPQVVLQYMVGNTLNGKPAPNWINDVYPPASTGQTPFAMVVPIDLTGVAQTTQTGQLDCEPLGCIGGTHATKRTWWGSKRGGEQGMLSTVIAGIVTTDWRVRFQTAGAGGAAPTAVLIGDATVTDDTGAAIDLAAYPQRLVKGNYHSWMKNGNTQINAIRAKIKVTVQLVQYDILGNTPAETDTNGNVVRKSTAHNFECHITLTNAPAGISNFLGYNTSGISEVPAIALARNIYNSRALLDYDGSHEIIDPGMVSKTPPLAQLIGHWNVLNFTGGKAEWANANMTIAGSEIDLMNNHQRLDIGPSKHLSPQDWNEMLQFFRMRQVFVFAGQRATGYGNPDQAVDMARNSPDGNTVHGLENDCAHVLNKYHTENDPNTPVTGQSNLDASLIESTLATGSPTAKGTDAGMRTMQPREIKVCDDAGNPYFIIVHATEGHTRPA